MVKSVNLRKYYAPLIVSVFLLTIFAAVMMYTLVSEKGSGENPSYSFPVGIPSALGTVSAAQVGEQQFNTVSVTGSGAASMRADQATVTLGVQTQDESASEAVRANAERMTEIIEAIKALGIAEENMSTVSYSVCPLYAKYDYDIITGYRVTNLVAVKIADMDLIGKVIDAAADRGANRVQSVSFGLSQEKREELKKQAYTVALNDAEGKAKLIAERLDLTITGVLYVGESTYQPYQPYRFYGLTVEEAKASTPIIEGKLSVSVTVHIIYSFE